MSRPHRTPAHGAERILEAYGPSLHWERLADRHMLTPETARHLHAEGYTMVEIRTGLWKTRRVSLIRYLQRYEVSG